MTEFVLQTNIACTSFSGLEMLVFMIEENLAHVRFGLPCNVGGYARNKYGMHSIYFTLQWLFLS